MKPVYLLLTVAFVLRLIFAVFHHNPGSSLFSDMRNYEVIADSILKGAWSPYHFFQPIGFSLILAFFKRLTFHGGIYLGLLHTLASTFSLWFIWNVTKRQWGEKVALLTLFLGTFHLPWIMLPGFALAETLFTFFTSLILWYSWKIYEERVARKWAIMWGIVFIMAFWLKGTHVFLAPLTFLTWWLYRKRSAFKQLIIPAGSMLAAGLLICGFFAYQTIGKFQMSGSAGGLNFVEGKCPYKWNEDANHIDWFSPIYYQRGGVSVKKWDRPFTDSSFFMKQGLICIAKDPRTLIMSLEGIPLLFVGNTQWPLNQLPSNPWIRLYELLLSLFMIPGLIVASLKLLAQRYEREMVVWLPPFCSILLCVYIFKSEIRFRIPFDVWLIPLSVFGWRELLATHDKTPLNGHPAIND